MSKSLSGVRADHKLSYAKLEKRAEYVREVLGIAADSHIDPAKLKTWMRSPSRAATYRFR
jgi:hypothetical protein